MIKNVKELKSLIKKKNSPKGLGASLFLVGPSLQLPPNPIITPASSFTTILNIQEYMF